MHPPAKTRLSARMLRTHGEVKPGLDILPRNTRRDAGDEQERKHPLDDVRESEHFNIIRGVSFRPRTIGVELMHARCP